LETAPSSSDSDRFALFHSMKKQNIANIQKKSGSKTLAILALFFFWLLIGLIIRLYKNIIKKAAQ